MDSGIRAPRTRYFNWFGEKVRERSLQRAGDRARLRLPLETGEIRSVVFDGKAQRGQRFARRSSALAAAKSRSKARSCIMTYAASVPAVQPDATSLG